MNYGKFRLKEDAPTNNVGSGQITAVGVGPQGEPGVNKKLIPRIKKILRKRNL